MARCDTCGEDVDMPYVCNRCGLAHCSHHRLPENHDCVGLEDWNDPAGVFQESTAGGSSRRLFERLGLETGVGGFLGYFRGNLTYLFLTVMWVTFFLQWVLAPLFGAVPGSPLWRALFVISAEHPEYVWTWVTSIFAHGGFGHIVVNSIVIFFFGRLVERAVGSRSFAWLFLGAGVLAGLAQIGLNALQGSPAGALGASGAGLAIMGTLTILNPKLRVYLYFLLPVPIWVLTIGYGLWSVVAIQFGAGGNVANAAHLVGLLVGFLYGVHVKDRVGAPGQIRLGGGPGGPGGPRGPGRGRI